MKPRRFVHNRRARVPALPSTLSPRGICRMKSWRPMSRGELPGRWGRCQRLRMRQSGSPRAISVLHSLRACWRLPSVPMLRR